GGWHPPATDRRPSGAMTTPPNPAQPSRRAAGRTSFSGKASAPLRADGELPRKANWLTICYEMAVEGARHEWGAGFSGSGGIRSATFGERRPNKEKCRCSALGSPGVDWLRGCSWVLSVYRLRDSRPRRLMCCASAQAARLP